MSKQVYVMPYPDERLPGWAVEVHGDEVVPDGSIVPLPLGPAVSYAEVLAFVASTPVGSGAMVDGWASADEMIRCEPELAQRIGWEVSA